MAVTKSGWALDHALDPCKLACNMEHSLDICKLVSSEGQYCRNMYWSDQSKASLLVDRVHDESDILVTVDELISLLRVTKGGCEQMCKIHDDCIDIGSGCKPNDTCANLFWNPGPPIESELSTCFESPDKGCADGTPVLCGVFEQVQSPQSVPKQTSPSPASSSKPESPSSKPPTKESPSEAPPKPAKMEGSKFAAPTHVSGTLAAGLIVFILLSGHL